MRCSNCALLTSVIMVLANTRTLALFQQKYSNLPASDFPSNLIRCQVYHEPRHAARIHCARLCQTNGCYMFGVEDSHCTIYPQCPTDPSMPLGPTPSVTMYKIGKSQKDTLQQATVLLHYDHSCDYSIINPYLHYIDFVVKYKFQYRKYTALHDVVMSDILLTGHTFDF